MSRSATPIARAMLSVPDAATYLGTTERHVRNLVYRRAIPYVKVGALVRFRLAELDAWLEANTVPAGGAV